MSFRRSHRLAAALTTVVLGAGGCHQLNVFQLAADSVDGRDNGSPGSVLVQDYLIDVLDTFAEGAVPGRTGDAAYEQAIPGPIAGTNLLAVIPGTDLADEYVIVGGHYDGLSSCRGDDGADTVCNAATDNAAGASAVLELGKAIAADPPRRSVLLALWDAEEDGLVGSRHYVTDPVVPLADTVAYVNFDILGSNLLPSLRDTTIAIGAESGGVALRTHVERATGVGPLDYATLSATFGQNRSDYVAFLANEVPSVFFTDATGGCYHTVDDDYGTVDFGKLRAQTATARRLTVDLANADERPEFVSGAPLATFDDARELLVVMERMVPDRSRFTPEQRAANEADLRALRRIVAEGPAAFDDDDVAAVLVGALGFVNTVSSLPCDGFTTSTN